MESESELIKSESKTMANVNSNDPEERKLARRNRIKARLEAAEIQKAIEEGTYVEKKPEKPLLLETIETSEDTIRQLYLEGKELVTNVMVASDAKEVSRRDAETEERNNRLEKLKEESALALEKLSDISSKWEAIMNINGPLELFQHMKEQKAKCLELIQQKNDLIKGFQMELKVADAKFMKGRKVMYEELALLTKRIDEQVLLMKKAYRIEMDHIEESIDITRTEIMEKHQKAWQTLYNQREKDEVVNMSSKFNLVESFHEELHKVHVDHEEKYRETRIHLDTDIHYLEQELEQVKALCLLNSEKLDYNFQVLKKREEENLYIKNHQRRRLNKLQDLVNVLKKKIEEKKQSTEEEYKKLAKEVERYYANVLATEQKAQRFSYVNDKKFDNIWRMKEEEARDLIEKILSADMIIHEQILGLDWVPPSNLNFNKYDLPSFKAAQFVKDVLKKKDSKPTTNPSKTTGNVKDLREGSPDPEVLVGHKRLLRHIYELIADQSGFLMEEKLDELLAPYTEDEKTFVRLDSVFVAIGLQTEKEIVDLKKVFLPYAVCFVCDKRRSSGESADPVDAPKSKESSRQHSILQMRELEEKVSKLRIQAKKGSSTGSEPSMSARYDNSVLPEHSTQFSSTNNFKETSDNRDSKERVTISSENKPGSSDKHRGTELLGTSKSKCDITHPLMIEKYNVLRALKDYVTLYHANRIKTLKGIQDKLSERRVTVSRLLSKDDIIMFWENFREVFTTENENRWDGVLFALTRYLTVLQERHELNVKARALRRRNLDLKRLLAHYKITENFCAEKLPPVLHVPNEPISLAEIKDILEYTIDDEDTEEAKRMGFSSEKQFKEMIKWIRDSRGSGYKISFN